jgi:hypothetical protein
MVKMLLRGRYKDFLIRLMGYQIIKKWEAQNRDYLAKLKQIYARG